MAKLMSKKTREIVQTVSVLVVVILFIVFYIVFPLITVPDLMARAEKEQFDDPEFTLANDPAHFIEMGLNPDTFTVITRDNVNLASLFFRPDSAEFDSALGTAILVHAGDSDRTALGPYIPPLLEAGFDVVIYDQRACGLSGGVWHTAGRYESDDLVDMIAELNIHDQLINPIVTVGFGVGADAVRRAAIDEQRIDYTVLVSPFLTGIRWMDDRIDHKDALWIPFANTVYYWWFKKISGFPYDKTTVDDLRPLSVRTALILPNDILESEAAAKLIEISPSDILNVVPYPPDDSAMIKTVVGLVRDFRKPLE